MGAAIARRGSGAPDPARKRPARDRCSLRLLRGRLNGKDREIALGERFTRNRGRGSGLCRRVLERQSYLSGFTALIPEGDLETAAEIAESVRTPWSRTVAVASVAQRLRPEVRRPAIEKTFGFVKGIRRSSLRAEYLALLSLQLPPAERPAVDEAWQLQLQAGAFTGHADEQRFP